MDKELNMKFLEKHRMILNNDFKWTFIILFPAVSNLSSIKRGQKLQLTRIVIGDNQNSHYKSN